MGALPTGTVTFLFADIEGSTRLLQALGDDRYAALLALHRAMLREAIAAEGGVEVDSSGDAFFAAFPTATAGARAALAIQRAIARRRWEADAVPRVRIGLHTGEPLLTPGGYVGLDVHRASRLCAAGHGGQVLLSETTSRLLRPEQVPGGTLRSLGLHRLKDLQRPEPITQLTAAELPDDFPPLRSLSSTPNNLPVQLTTFVGRQREMADVRMLIERNRIVTLTGPAGGGKTRLALQVAADLIDHFPDGVWLVELEHFNDPAQLAPAVAAALQVTEGPAPLEQTIARTLSTRTALLLLDNCEHLVEACARLTVALTRTCPGLRVLATSRQALHAAGEAIYPVGPLPLPRLSPAEPPDALAANDAVALFLARAQLVQHDFRLTEETAAAIVRIVHRLEGLPLAIELAAARTRVLGATDIARRLEDHLRLIIDGRAGSVAGRRQTLRGALDWSYGLLSPLERWLFQRLAVFSGFCRLEAVEAVCADDRLPRDQVLDLVEGLLDRSLLQADRSQDRQGYRMLEIVRAYATEKLEDSGEAAEVRDRHLDYYIHVAAAAAAAIRGAGQQQALAELSHELDNFRAALRWALEAPRPEPGLRLAGQLWWFWYLRGHWAEATHWLDRLLAFAPSVPEAAIEPLNGAAYLAWRQGRYGEAERRAAEALRLARACGSRQGEAHALLVLGLLARRRDRFAEAVAFHEQSLAAFRAIADGWMVGRSLTLLAIAVSYTGDYERALRLLEESRALSRRLEDAHGVARSTYGLARIHVVLGRWPEALALLDEAEHLYRTLDDAEGLASVRQSRGIAASCQGRHAEARALLEQSLTHFQQSGDRWSTRDVLTPLAAVLLALGDLDAAERRLMEGLLDDRPDSMAWDALGTADALEVLALIDHRRGRAEQAARWLGAAAAIRERTGAPLPPYRQAQIHDLAGALRTALSPAVFEIHHAAGRSLTAAQVADELRRRRGG
ncbi:MAG TPA: tetratricopeptide repeat protein [bacterium]|nr:tetratricopeptide repeat protein [bacterium]